MENCNKRKKVIIWNTEVDDLYLKKGLIGGLAVQMRYWTETFVKKGWDVYAPTCNKSRVYNGIRFFRYYDIPKIGIVTEYIFALYHLLCIKPDLILLRGARRQLGSVATFAKLLNIKVVFLGASDADFKPEEELINDKKSRKIYRTGIRKTGYFVLQNKAQEECLARNYGEKKHVIIPNIWPLTNKNGKVSRDIDFLWVGNFRELKRPQWFIQLAKDNPQYKFAMVGGSANGNQLYKDCEEKAKRYPNFEFLGRTDFDDVNKLFERARIYVCTSEIEGFPNTFLQAWSNNIPVITTFDPSDTVKTNGLGLCVNSYEELNATAKTLIGNQTKQQEIQQNIAVYFKESHNADSMYERIIKMIEC